MIVERSLLLYALSIFLGIFILFRLKFFLNKYCDSDLSWAISTAVMLHPQTIDTFTAPHFIGGVLAFSFCLEALICFEQTKNRLGLLLLAASSVCNLNYTFILFYFLWINGKTLKEFIIPALMFVCFSCLYLVSHLQDGHILYVINFFVTFIENSFIPVKLNIFSYSYLPFSWSMTLAISILLTTLLLRQRKNTLFKYLYPTLFLPAAGIMFSSWTESYQVWSDVLVPHSNFLIITFAFVVLLALSMPRKIFYAYTLLLIYVSFQWTISSFPFSNLMENSLIALPESYKKTVEARNALAWQYYFENDFAKAETELKALLKTYPQREDLQKNFLFDLIHQTKKK